MSQLRGAERGAGQGAEHYALTVHVNDHDAIGKDDPLGGARLQLAEVDRRARSPSHLAPPPIQCVPDSLTYAVPVAVNDDATEPWVVFSLCTTVHPLQTSFT